MRSRGCPHSAEVGHDAPDKGIQDRLPDRVATLAKRVVWSETICLWGEVRQSNLTDPASVPERNRPGQELPAKEHPRHLFFVKKDLSLPEAQGEHC